MSIKDALIGAKGGSSGGTYRNNPDNLRSTDTFEALIGVISGRIKGLAPGGLKNLMINDVPLEDGQGKSTLADFSAVLFDGDPTILRPVQLLLGGSSGSTPIGQQLANTFGGAGPGDWHYGAVTVPSVDFIDVRLVVQQLFRQDDKGVYEATANVEVELQASGTATWINPMADLSAASYSQNGMQVQAGVRAYISKGFYNDGQTAFVEPNPGAVTITGKTTSNYVKELRVAVPNTGTWANRTWQVRLRLRERDTYQLDTNEERRTILWESIAGVSSKPIGDNEDWRGLAYLQVNGKASDQLTGIPAIEGIYDLAMFKVPPASVWNPETRVYTGATWDGSTNVIAWSQCPAFRIKDLIEDPISGLSALSPGSTMNRWDALEASKWFAERVPDGKGGVHPRYSLNFNLDQPMAAEEAVNYLAGAVGSFAYDQGDGDWRMIVEKPENPVALFTEENIIGEFAYAHSDSDTRFNDIVGVYRDEDHNYEENRVRTFDQPNIDLLGRKPTQIALVGCTNRQEALRRVEIRKITSLKETRSVTFVTNRQGRMLQPFSVIAVADGSLGPIGQRTTGRIISMTGDRKQITVRDPIRVELGVGYKVTLTVPNPNYNPDPNAQPSVGDWKKPTIQIERLVLNTAAQRGDTYVLYLDEALPANTPANANISLSAPGLPAMPKLYRVLDLARGDDGETVSISALEIYSAKWIESDNVTEAAILGQVPNRTVKAPTPPTGSDLLQLTILPSNRIVLEANWQRPAGMSIDGYRVWSRFNDGAWTSPMFTRDLHYEIPNPAAGKWEVRVETQDRRGAISLPLVDTIEVTQEELVDLSAIIAQINQFEIELNKVGSDGWLSKGEKPKAVIDYQALVNDANALYARYLALGSPVDLGDEVTAQDIALTALATLLGGLVPQWDDPDQDTEIPNPNLYRTRWVDAYRTIALLRAGITGRQGAPGASAFTLADVANTAVTADTVTKISGGGGWNGKARTVQGYRGAVVSCSSLPIDTFIGLGTTPSADSNFTSEYQIHHSSADGGRVSIWNGGSQVFITDVQSHPNPVSALIQNDGRIVSYYVNGALVHAHPAPGVQTLYGTFNIYSIGRAISGITFAAAGVAGSDGTAAGLTNQSHTVPALFNGTVTSYAGATGQFTLNGQPVGSAFTLSTVANPQGLAVSYSGANYTVSGGLDPSEDAATVVIRATGNGVAYDQIFTLVKSKGGANGSAPPLISASISSSVARYNADDVPTFGDVTVQTVRTNTSDDPLFELVSFNGQQHGFTGRADALRDTYGVATFDTTNTDQLIIKAAWLNIIMQSYGGGLRIRTIVNGTYDVVSITKVRDGTNGDPGAPGVDGFIVDTETTSFIQPVFSGGANKPSWTGASGTIRLTKGKTRITGGVSYAVLNPLNIVSLALSGDTFSFAGTNADKGSFTIRAAYDGVVYDRLITVTKVFDGEAAFRGSTLLGTQNVGASVVSMGNATTTVPGGRGCTLSAVVNYDFLTNQTSDFVGRLHLYWRNVTDNGPLTYLGYQDGSVASVRNFGTVQEPEYVRSPGSVSASFAFASPNGDKAIYFEARLERIAGGGGNARASGSMKLEVTS